MRLAWDRHGGIHLEAFWLMASSSQRVEIVQSEGLTLSLIVWRLFKRQPDGYVERVLKLNPGLADLGVILPVGTRLVLPLDEQSAAPKRAVVRLWGDE